MLKQIVNKTGRKGCYNCMDKSDCDLYIADKDVNAFFANLKFVMEIISFCL